MLETGEPMRILLFVPFLAASLACGGFQLTRREAETDIRKDYPVVITIAVPESAKAIKGSPDFAKLVSLQEHLVKAGWFTVERHPDGDKEQFAFKLTPAAPKTVRTTAKGFQLPAAEAEFVRAIRMDNTRDGARVTYQVRLVRPTAQFALFQALHAGVRIGDMKDRHASYRREGRSWILQDTDETFKKAQ
jgi:hypothetical protein